MNLTVIISNITNILKNEKAFTLRQLICIWAILGIIGLMTPHDFFMNDGQKLKKAQYECRIIADMIEKNNFKYKSKKNPLITARLLRCAIPDVKHYETDPWHNYYVFDTSTNTVFSMGPDGRHSAKKNFTWNDDIRARVEFK